MSTAQLEALCHRVFESLDRAVAEGYENIIANTAEETAVEIGEYDQQLGDVPTDVLRQIIAAWLANRRWGQPTFDKQRYFHARTGEPVATLAEAVHSVLDTMCASGSISWHPRDMLGHVQRRFTIDHVQGPVPSHEELLPHVEAWYEEYGCARW